MKIAIFDDNRKEADITRGLLEQYTAEWDMQAELFVFTEEDALLSCVREEAVDAVFLDILVGTDAKGIEIAQEINAVSEDTFIIFLTGYLRYATDIYDTRHIYFVLKTELSERLPGVFEKIAELSGRQEDVLIVRRPRENLILKKKKILYIERDRRITHIVCKDQMCEVADKIDELEKALGDPAFIRCHNSFIVNFNHVRKFDSHEITLKNGCRIPISRARRKELEERFAKWMQNYM